jgi:hypothetical protein
MMQLTLLYEYRKAEMKLFPARIVPINWNEREAIGIVEIDVKFHSFWESERITQILSGASSTLINTSAWEMEVIWQTVRLLIEKFDQAPSDLIPELEAVWSA